MSLATPINAGVLSHAGRSRGGPSREGGEMARSSGLGVKTIQKRAPVRDRGPDVVAGVRLSHPDRILYPEQGLTKRDLAGFYDRISSWILPHIVERPLSLLRCPEGQGKACFFQKHAGTG